MSHLPVRTDRDVSRHDQPSRIGCGGVFRLFLYLLVVFLRGCDAICLFGGDLAESFEDVGGGVGVECVLFGE